MGKYTDIETAKNMGGLRLVTTRGVPGPWGEAAKSMMYVKNIPVVNVAQEGGQENAELVAWIGINNAPVAIWENERPRTGWVEILMLAERLQPEPTLIPRIERDRAWMFGLTHELCSEDGYGWNRRLMFLAGWEAALRDNPQPSSAASLELMRGRYDPGTDTGHATRRMIEILTLLSQQLREQKSRGSHFMIGEQLSVLDIYSACFTAMVRPLPIELCPTSPEMHYGYHERNPDIVAAAGEIMLQHRDNIYNNFLELPLNF